MVEFDLFKNKVEGIKVYKKALEMDPDINVSKKIKDINTNYKTSSK